MSLPIVQPGSEGAAAEKPVTDESKKEFIREKLGPEAVPEEQPEEKRETPEPEKKEKEYAGKFKSDSDLENAYLEAEKKITSQGNLISAMKILYETDEKGDLVLDEQGKPVPRSAPAEQTTAPEKQEPEGADLMALDLNKPEALEKFVRGLGMNPETLQEEFYGNPVGTLVKLAAKVSDMKTRKVEEFISGQKQEKALEQTKKTVVKEYEDISKQPFFKQYEKEILGVFDEIPELALQPKAYEKAMAYFIGSNMDRFAETIQESGIREFLSNMKEMKAAAIEKGAGDKGPTQEQPTAQETKMAENLGITVDDLRKNKGGK